MAPSSKPPVLPPRPTGAAPVWPQLAPCALQFAAAGVLSHSVSDRNPSSQRTLLIPLLHSCLKGLHTVHPERSWLIWLLPTNISSHTLCSLSSTHICLLSISTTLQVPSSILAFPSENGLPLCLNEWLLLNPFFFFQFKYYLNESLPRSPLSKGPSVYTSNSTHYL